MQGFDNASILKDEDTACKACSIGVVGYHEDGGFQLCVYLAEFFQKGCTSGGIQGAGRLVGKEDGRIFC